MLKRLNAYQKERVAAITALLAITALFSAYAVFGALSGTQVVKLNPASIESDASGSWVEDPAAWALFDRDTTSTYAPSASSARLLVTLPAAADITALKVYGSAAYSMAVYDGSTGSWVKVAGLDAIALKSQSAAWNTFIPTGPVHSDKLMLELKSAGGNTGGVKEIEIWGSDAGDPALSLKSVITTADIATVLSASPRPAHILELTGTPQTIDVPADSNPYSITVTLNADPRQIKRAYLLYDSYNSDYLVSAERRINKGSWSGGFVIPTSATPEWKGQKEEINPTWLTKGANTIEFRNQLASREPSSYFIRNVKVVAELENGWNLLSQLNGNAENATHGAQAASDGDLTTYFELKANHALDIKAERTVQPDTLRINLWSASATPTGSLTLQYLQGSQWKNFASGGTIDLAGLKNGWNDIKLPAAIATDTIRMNFHVVQDKKRQGATVGGINEVQLIASPLGPRISRGLVINYPTSGEYFGRTAYIQGFVDPASDGTGIAQISVEGKGVSSDDGSISTAVSKDETKFAAQTDNDPWSATVTAAYPGGSSLTNTVELTKNLLNNTPSDSNNSNQSEVGQREKHVEKVIPGQAKKIQYKGVTLDIPADAVSQETEITIIPLTETDLNRLNPGMINVTFPDAGYRFLPHGMKFKKPIKISFGYSKTLFAAGQVDDEVNMYYYDESLLRWQKLNRTKVDAAVSQVTSESDHFTDIINSTLVVPEHPQALSFNPNSIKDIKAADPTANVNLIEPPKANNKGTANLSYPIEVPPGRNKLQPSLAVQYNSSGGNGWMGLSWDMSIPSISIDTRFGAPVYDEDKRKETYLLNGQQLVLAPNGEYRLRVEGAFSRVVRHGAGPGSYWWVVTDKSGTRYVYGGDESAQLRNPDGTNVFTWYLSRIVDMNGNTVDYIYQPKNQPEHNKSGVIPGQYATYTYISEIRYPGNAGKGKTDDQIRNVPAAGTGSYYRISFVNDTVNRLDAVVDGRPGFETVLDERLKSIVEDAVLSTGTRRIRRYEFNYKLGDFDKTLLESVVQKGADDKTEFNRHSFDYYEMPKLNGGYDAFELAPSWSIPGVGGGLSLTRNDDRYGGFFLGFFIITDALHIGAGWGWGSGDSNTSLSTLDVNGDGLPDYLQANGPYYKNNWVTKDETGSAFNMTVIGDNGAIDSLAKEEYKSRSFDMGLHIGETGGFSGQITRGSIDTDITGKTMMADINGDGLVDQLIPTGYGLAVRLNNGNGFDPVMDWNGGVNLDHERSPEDTQRLLDQYPLHDTVRAWKAPFKGTVNIIGTIGKVTAADTNHGEDGVKIGIYKGMSSAPVWEKVFMDAETVDLSTISALQQRAIDRGETIYVKASSIEDSDNDTLNTDITVNYTSITYDVNNTPQSFTLVNEPRFDQTLTGDPQFSSNSKAGFAMAALAPDTLDVNPVGSWDAPFKGKIRLTNSISKQVSSEDLRLQVRLVSGQTVTTLFDQVVSAATATTINDVLENLEIKSDDKLIFDISAPKLGTVRADRVAWTPEVRYQNVCTRYKSGVNLDDPSTFMPKDDQKQEEYLDSEECVDLTEEQQTMTDQDIPGAVPPSDGMPPLKLYIFKPTPILNVYPFKRLSPTEAWVAPRTGTVRIVSNSYKAAEMPSDVHMKIQSTNQLISQLSYTAGEIRSNTTYTVDVQVVEGQRLFFNIVSKETITPLTVKVQDGDTQIEIPSFDWGHEILYVNSPHCYTDTTTKTEICVDVAKNYGTNALKNKWSMHFDRLCLAQDRCVIVDCTGNRQPGVPVQLAASSCVTTEYVPNPDPNLPPTLVHKVVTQDERASAGLDRYEYFVPAVNRDSLEWQVNDRSPLQGFYRDWAYVLWNGNKTWDPSLLVTPETALPFGDPWHPTDQELDQIKLPDFWQIKPFAFGTNRYPGIPSWSTGSFDFMTSEQTQPYRAGGNITPFIRVPKGIGIANLRKTRNKQTKYSLGIGPIGGSKSSGPVKTELDLVDMNGDRYPDLVSPYGIVYNHGTPGSGFDGSAAVTNLGIMGEGALRKTDSKSISLSYSGGTLYNTSDSSGQEFKMTVSKPTLGVGYGSSRTTVELIDINGDGLPDRVYRDGGSIIVRLNLGGNHFGEHEDWTAAPWSIGDISRQSRVGSVSPNAVRATDTVSVNVSMGGGGGGGMSGGSGSYGGGISATMSMSGSRTIVDLVDVNGDGLPDLVMKTNENNFLSVRINRGNGFGPEIPWYTPGWGTQIGQGATARLFGGNDVLGYNDQWTKTGGANLSIHFRVWILVIWIEANGNISTGEGASSLALMDVNGDGAPDQVYRASAMMGGAGSSTVRIKYSKVGKANLLKSIKRPLGGKIELNYERRGNTFDMPHSQWVLWTVSLTDGKHNTYSTTCDYGNGYYSRKEREFYGFDKVIEIHAPGTGLQRTLTQTFDNLDYYLRNLVQKSVTTDKDGTWTRTINTYDTSAVKVMRGSGMGGAVVPGAKFPLLLETDTYFYAGGTKEDSFAKSTGQKFGYDDYGNVSSFTDFADDGADDDVHADIGYWTVDDDAAYMTKPSSILVWGKNTSDIYRERTADYDPSTGNLAQLTMKMQSGTNPVWVMGYDPNNGNLTSMMYPSGDAAHQTNKKPDPYVISYAYDDELSTFVKSISDSFGYTSLAGYQYEFGQSAWTRDINGNYQVNVYDNFGRLARVCGPYESVSGSQEACKGVDIPTLAFTYALAGLDPVTNDISAPASAVTLNRAESSMLDKPDTLTTATFADGMKRIIQTKKQAQVADIVGMTVSGTIVFDQLGRVKEQDQASFNTSKDSLYIPDLVRYNTTRLYYDGLDRTTRVESPDAGAPGGIAVTTTTYGFGAIAGVTGNLFKTRVIDPEGSLVNGAEGRGTKISYKDVHDRIHAVVEYNKVGGAVKEIVTTYNYDTMGQITHVKDVKNNITTVSYDRLGRRLTINNPDTGLTKYTYDPNGNVTTKETANLRNGAKKVSYQYEYNRLREIEYPDSPHVVYEYGTNDDANNNQVGRIKKVTDESGEEERYYGKLGEVVKERRRVNAFNNPVSRTWYETKYVFDSFGRMKQLTYPDGEVLNYEYDGGGLLRHAEGTKRANRYVYINKLTYNKEGQRSRMEYGNGVYSVYTYDDTTKRLANLNTIALDRKASRVIQNIDYKYDLVGNILNTDNTRDVPVPPGGQHGGPTHQDFTYDNMYQLVAAGGWHQTADNKKTIYTDNFTYDFIGNIRSKVQTHLIVHGLDPATSSSTNPRDTNYSLTYQYMTSGSLKPHAVTETEDKLYKYDDNGNMTDWVSKVSGQNRHISWNEENRVKSIMDQGSTIVFLYDDAGERAVKRGQMGETVYVSRFYSLKNGGLGSKHVFAGETRVCTKLEKDGGSLSTGVPGSTALVNSRGILSAYTRGNGQKRGIERRLNPYAASNPPIEKFQFFYHGDHLGSSSFITDDDGAVYQHLEYFPYGETWVEDGGTGQMPMYRFTGKELDPETGLYYYGARYYDPVLSRWISADPLLGTYLSGQPNQGVYKSINLDSFRYAANNPVRLLDPTGMAEKEQQQQAAQQADDGIEQAIKDRQWQFRNTQEGLKKIEPVAEAAVELNPIIGATVAISGKSSIEGREVSTLERILCAPFIGTILKEAGLGAKLAKNMFGAEVKTFKSFEALKRTLGAAGESKVWHHIVEQRAANVEKFGADAIHNTGNVISVDASVNSAIANYYSTKQAFTGGQTVREWLGSQSFSEQYQFGKEVLERAMSGQPLR